jgi:hypothetical protein
VTWKDKLAIAVFSLLLMFLLAAVLCAVAFLLAFRFGLSRLGVALLCLSIVGCAKPALPVIPVVPLEEIHLGASIQPGVVLCVENPDDVPTRPRWACLTMDAVRRWFAQARVAD